MNESLNVEVARRIVNTLNRAHAADAHALQQLIDARVMCNRDLAEDPTIQVGVDDETGRYRVGLLGILNGIAGKIQHGSLSGYGYVCAIYQVACPQDERHPVTSQLVGDPCPECRTELVTGKLLGFDVMEGA